MISSLNLTIQESIVKHFDYQLFFHIILKQFKKFPIIRDLKCNEYVADESMPGEKLLFLLFHFIC